jgi:hypothetical protein
MMPGELTQKHRVARQDNENLPPNSRAWKRSGARCCSVSRSCPSPPPSPASRRRRGILAWRVDAPRGDGDQDVVRARGPPLQRRQKPLRRGEFPVTFTDAQWRALQQTFPVGVCDYGRSGVHQHGAVAWLTYQDARGQVIHGGRPPGPTPTSHPL